MKCAICLHLPPAANEYELATPAITMIAGMALCLKHMDWALFPLHIEDRILEINGSLYNSVVG